MIVETDGGWASMLLPFLIVVIIGILGVGAWLVWVLTRSNKKKPRVGAPPAPTAVPEVSGDIPFLIGRRSQFGDWELYINGQRVRRLAAVTDPAEREELFAAVRYLVTFAGDGTTTEIPEQVTPSEPPPAANQVAEAAPVPPPPAAERRERYSRATSTDDTGPAVDLIQEISDILDEIVAVTPDMAGHSIGLINDPSGGIGFAVDGKIYHDLSEIPSPEIRAVIRRATKEWERR